MVGALSWWWERRYLGVASCGGNEELWWERPNSDESDVLWWKRRAVMGSMYCKQFAHVMMSHVITILVMAALMCRAGVGLVIKSLIANVYGCFSTPVNSI